MNLTVSLDDAVGRRAHKIAAERDTTVTALAREHLESLAQAESAAGCARRERQVLERSFEQFHFKVGRRTWNRADLHARN